MSSAQNYIPLGCLVTTREELALSDDKWEQLSEKYKSLADISSAGSTTDDGTPRLALLDKIDKALLQSVPLTTFQNLVVERWIRIQSLVTHDERESVIIRVYVLPDDIDRRLIDRERSKLKKSRALLFTSLDCSPQTWKGRPPSVPTSINSICTEEDAPEGESPSLLQMFNTMPSPDPTPEVIHSQGDQLAAYSVLASDIPGLKTTLYDYQRRSGALMIQRESEPGQFLDPRLLRGKDQDSADFFVDTAHSGTLLKQPRYYDGVRGGILAEQMGAGKTLICLSVILATRHSAALTPELYRGSDVPIRQRVGTLADMAAACATRKAAPWKTFFNAYGPREDTGYPKCLDAIERNPAWFYVPPPMPKRPSRYGSYFELPPKRVWNSHASLVIVPNNLVKQWMQEIEKHTAGAEEPANLKVLTLTNQKEEIPAASELAGYDIVLISHSRLVRIFREEDINGCPLVKLHYKRCIVDEGHKLGRSKIANKSDLLLALDLMSISARWIVTGTPSNGLYGVDGEQWSNGSPDDEPVTNEAPSAAEAEKADLEKIGAIASLYLNARPWSNSSLETEDTTADWAVYVMQPKHSSRSCGRKDVLRATLNSLLIRHQLSELNNLLPAVDENVVVLEGSYQDKLALNVFSMMIIFNAVQSQRTDMDFFFHPRQKKALLQLLHNLKQASFFGGSFFSPEDITKSLETAQEFLNAKKVFISDEDEVLLKKAIGVARTALDNPMKKMSNKFNEIPIFVRDFLPNGAGAAWSLDDKNTNPACTDAGMVIAVQKLIRSSLGDAAKLNSLLNGQLLEEGHKEVADQVIFVAQVNQAETRHPRMATVLAGNTRLGGDMVPRHLRATARQAPDRTAPPEQDVPEELKRSELVSTASAKLSYLIDAVVEHQTEEKIIIFYENENVAWYLASMLDVIQVPHLIYAKTLSYERKMQYINTFNDDPMFRVILMDLSQAAVGLDMRAASRIYFINPVLNPQIQAQAIGRARRISQQKPVSVETLVLRGSIEEVIVERKKSMTQIEHWNCKSILDDRPIYNWILNARIIPLPEEQSDNLAQVVPLKHPQPVFGGGFGREHHPDQDLIMGDVGPASHISKRQLADNPSNGSKRPRSPEPQDSMDSQDATARPARRLRFAEDDDTSAGTSVIGEGSSTGAVLEDDQQNGLAPEATSPRPARQVRFS